MSDGSLQRAMDLERKQHIHIVGVGGAGMSAIAVVLAAMGHEVTGSDIKASAVFQRLKSLGLSLEVGHDAVNVVGADALTLSSAIDPSNSEVAEARRLGIPIFSRADVLAGITGLRRTIAVAGTHGKTTTASMLAVVLVEAGFRPSFIIGGDLNDIGTNAVWDTGEWLVVEADESDRTFLRLSPEVAVVTSIEPDHLETYGSFATLRDAFATFMAGASRVVVSADDRTAMELAPSAATSFGKSDGASYRISALRPERSQITFALEHRSPTARSADRGSAGGTLGPTSLGEFSVAAPGEHNARNAAAAIVAALSVGAEPDAARRALGRFGGVARRFEFRGTRDGVTFVDDYAHLPSEVRAALAAARSGGFERVVCVFQPHRYSRIASLAPDFSSAFVDCDLLFVTDVYSAGERARPGVTGHLVVDAVLGAHPEADVVYTATHEELLGHLRASLRSGDCCITLQAGDLTDLADELLAGATW